MNEFCVDCGHLFPTKVDLHLHVNVCPTRIPRPAFVAAPPPAVSPPPPPPPPLPQHNLPPPRKHHLRPPRHYHIPPSRHHPPTKPPKPPAAAIEEIRLSTR